jgi:3D (Asp-Asp-Asp) domain-containing protein
MDKLNINRKRISLLKMAAITAGIGCIIHFGHRECSRFSDNSFINYNLQTFHMPSSPRTETGDFHATAYCITGTTTTGAQTVPGIVAADPEVIPLGSMIYIESPLMGGIYHVLDTGGLVKGKIIDIFIPDYERCVNFGRRLVKVKILRYGFWGNQPDAKLDKQPSP